MSKTTCRPLNKRVTRFPHEQSGFFKAIPVYLSSSRTETYDITEAMLDFDGAPIVVRMEHSQEPLDICISAPCSISFSPTNPVERTQAFEQLSAFSKRSSMPCILMDKFEVSKMTENVCNKLSHQFEKLQEHKLEHNVEPSASANPSTSPSEVTNS